MPQRIVQKNFQNYNIMKFHALPKIENARVLITGGAGFIGSALTWYLNTLGIEDIIIVDALGKSEKWRNLAPLKFEEYFEADNFLNWLKEDEKLLSSLNVKYVFHMGACTSNTEKDASYLVENNFAFTKHLYNATSLSKARFIYASSASTYGDGSNGMSDTDENLSVLRPLTMYSYSKHMFDLWLCKRGELKDAIGLKYFNIFGPNEYHKESMRSLIYKAYDQIQKVGSADLFKSYNPDFEDGMQKRDFLYVKDAVKMTFALATNPNAKGIYNIGSGIATTWLDFIRPIFKALNKPEKINFIEMPESMRSKYQYYTCANIDKLRGSGFIEKTYSIEDAVKECILDYLVDNKRFGD